MANLTQATAASKPVVVESGTGYGVEFNVSGNPQFLSAPVPTGIAGAGNYTFSMWIKRVGSLGEFADFPMVFGLTVDGGSTTTGAGLARSTSTSQALTLTDTGSTLKPLSTGDLALNEWVHVAGVRESGVNARMLVNGAVVDTSTEIMGISSSLGSYLLTVGAARDGARPVPIQASNLQVWNIALTDQQVQDWAMTRLTGMMPSGLIFYAPM